MSDIFMALDSGFEGRCELFTFDTTYIQQSTKIHYTKDLRKENICGKNAIPKG